MKKIAAKMRDASSKSRPLLSPWPTASLSTYLVAVILAATVPIALLVFYQMYGQVGSQRERLQAEMQRSAALLAHSVNRELVSSIDALNILSYSADVQQEEITRLERALQRRPLMRPSWSSVYVLSSKGDLIFDAARPAGDAKVDDEMPEGNGAPSPLVSNLRRDHSDEGLLTTVEVPVLINNTQRYVLGARIKASVWQQMVENASLSGASVSSIYDRNYRLIARNVSPEKYVGKTISSANRALMHNRASGVDKLIQMEGGNIYAAWDTVPLAGWGVAIGMPAAPIDAANNKALAMALATVVACLLLGVLLALLVARRMTLPLHRLALNDLSQPAERISVREISMLRDALIAAQAKDEASKKLLAQKGAQLQATANEFETLFASSPIGLSFAQDAQCKKVIHNIAMEDIFSGTVPGEVTVLRDGVPLPVEEQPLQRAAAYGETTHSMELEVVVAGNPPVFVIVNAVPLFDEHGHTRGAIGVAIDITKRKASEARLLAAEQGERKIQRLVDLAQETGHIGFFQYQADADRLAWTRGQAKLFGIDDDDILPVLGDWVWRIDRLDWYRMRRRLVNAFHFCEDNTTLDYRIRRPNASICWLSTRLRLIYDDEGRLQEIVGVSIDISEQKEAERQRMELERLEKEGRIQAESANRAKDEFLAMLGHELRNPLSAIASGVEVLNRVDGASEVAGNARRIIDRQARHLADMMDDLLDVARLISGQIVMSTHRLDLATLVQRVVATLEITGQPQKHQLVVDVHEVWVEADITRMEQVVNNLLINAIKYTPPGGRITVSVRPENGGARLIVQDTGIGIAPELLPQVFDLFVQGARSLDRRGGGLGVGLTLTRRLVELHGGTISIVNADPGTIVSVLLPAIDAMGTKLLSTTTLPVSARRIAVIEDNPDVLEALRSILELEGHTVMIASDGVEGLELLLREHPEVAIVDIGLPGMNGFEVAKSCRAGGYAGRMFAVSGYGQAHDVKLALSVGFDLHFVKPIDWDALRSAISES